MNLSAGSTRSFRQAPATVMMPLTIVAQDGARRMRLITMPRDCTHSGIAL